MVISNGGQHLPGELDSGLTAAFRRNGFASYSAIWATKLRPAP
jgi:hypothetical protein